MGTVGDHCKVSSLCSMHSTGCKIRFNDILVPKCMCTQCIVFRNCSQICPERIELTREWLLLKGFTKNGKSDAWKSALKNGLRDE